MGRSTICPKCGGKLVKSGLDHVIPWPKQPRNTGTIQGMKIEAYECEKCRYIEFYGMIGGFE